MLTGEPLSDSQNQMASEAEEALELQTVQASYMNSSSLRPPLLC